MADGFAPAIDKVGPPAHRAPEAQAAAPSFGAPPYKPAVSNPLAPQSHQTSFQRNDAPMDKPAGHVDPSRENKPSGLPSIFGGPKPDAPHEKKPSEGVSILGGPKPDLPPKPSGGLSSNFGAPKMDAPQEKKPSESLSSLFGAPKADALQEKKPNEGLPSIFGALKADAPQEKKLDGGLGVHLPPKPKPVEVDTAPDTPMNGSTPAGASPRPELKITPEPTSVPKEPMKLTDPDPPKPAAIPPLAAQKEKTPEPPKAAEPLIMTGRDGPKPAAAPAFPSKQRTPEPHVKKAEPTVSQPSNGFKPGPPATHAGPAVDNVPAPAPAPAAAPVSAPPPQAESVASKPTESAPSLGDKRKLEDSSPVAPAAAKPLTEDKAMPDAAPLEKKPKLDEPKAPALALDAARTAAEASKPKPKPRAKKEKKPPVVGRTQRKTRSQGPVDV